MLERAGDLSVLARGRVSGEDSSAVGVPLPAWKWRTRVLLPASILLATAGVLAWATRDALFQATPVKAVPVMVKTGAVSEVVGTVIVQAPGWVEADPFSVAVSALADGVVEDVLVLEGARVAKGQVVARLIDDDARIGHDRTAAMVAEREADLAAARAKLEEAERNWEYPIELTRRLETADAMLAEKRAELMQWPAELERDEAMAVFMKAEFERVIGLGGAGQASEIERIRAEQEFKAQKARVEIMRRREAILKAEIQRMEAEVRAAREELHLRIEDQRALAEWKAAVRRAEAGVMTARAVLADAALRLERMAVKSPADGVVMNRLAEPGSKLMLHMDDPRSAQVVRLYDPKKLQVRVDIPLVDAAKVGVGQPAEVIVDVLPDRVYDGVVTRIVHEADVQKNTLQVKVAIKNPTAEIMPEMLARARFLSVGRSQEEAGEAVTSNEQLFVPERAIVEGDGGTFVWVADQVAEVARRQSVELSRARMDEWVGVRSGVMAGDRVIAEGFDALEDGERIRIVEE
jgi:RND family efflux transporter MFP subunit